MVETEFKPLIIRVLVFGFKHMILGSLLALSLPTRLVGKSYSENCLDTQGFNSLKHAPIDSSFLPAFQTLNGLESSFQDDEFNAKLSDLFTQLPDANTWMPWDLTHCFIQKSTDSKIHLAWETLIQRQMEASHFQEDWICALAPILFQFGHFSKLNADQACGLSPNEILFLQSIQTEASTQVDSLYRILHPTTWNASGHQKIKDYFLSKSLWASALWVTEQLDFAETFKQRSHYQRILDRNHRRNAFYETLKQNTQQENENFLLEQNSLKERKWFNRQLAIGVIIISAIALMGAYLIIQIKYTYQKRRKEKVQFEIKRKGITERQRKRVLGSERKAQNDLLQSFHHSIQPAFKRGIKALQQAIQTPEIDLEFKEGIEQYIRTTEEAIKLAYKPEASVQSWDFLIRLLCNQLQDKGLRVIYSNSTAFNTRKAARIYFAIRELISNSLKYAKCSEITIEVQEHDQRLVLHYSDNGQGAKSSSSTGGLQRIAQQMKLHGGQFSHQFNPGFHAQVIY